MVTVRGFLGLYAGAAKRLPHHLLGARRHCVLRLLRAVVIRLRQHVDRRVKHPEITTVGRSGDHCFYEVVARDESGVRSIHRALPLFSRNILLRESLPPARQPRLQRVGEFEQIQSISAVPSANGN